MLAVIYRRFVFPECEQEYQQAWHEVALYFKEHGGAIGSCLHKTDKKNEWIAYSMWPDQETREVCWIRGEGLPEEIKGVIQKLKDCTDLTKPHEEICMNVIDDLLLRPIRDGENDLERMTNQMSHHVIMINSDD